MEKLLKIKEVSELIGISVKSLYEGYHGTNTIPRVRMGERTIRFRQSDVEEWIRRHIERPHQRPSLVMRKRA